MYKQQKKATLAQFKLTLEGTHFYIVDTELMNTAQLYSLRHMLFKEGIGCKHLPNAVLRRLFAEDAPQQGLKKILKKNSTVLFTKEHPATAAKIIQNFRKKEKIAFPLFKGAWVFNSVYLGEERLAQLAQLKSKEEYIADIIAILQSQFWQLAAALQEGQAQLCNVLKTIATQK